MSTNFVSDVTGMPLAAAISPGERAAYNFAANCDALKHSRSAVLGKLVPPRGLEWVLARDGSLTSLTADGAWWAGCSLPWRAARAMLKTLKLESLFGCFLWPGWAAQLRLSLDLIEPRQGVLAACPDVEELTVMLHCENFAEEIVRGRLWLATGPTDWTQQIEAIFDAEPGLVVPSQFIRTMSRHKDAIDAMIPPAQQAFAQINARRSIAIEQLHASQSATGKLCVVCPSQFSLWREAGPALAEAIESSDRSAAARIVRLDPDCPTSASPLALARATSDCDALLIPDAGRGDLPGTVSRDVGWITWVTRGGIPDAASAGPQDRLLLAEPAWQRAAIDAGWPAERTAIAEWPAAQANSAAPANPTQLALIADTLPADAPKAVSDFSSQGILWDHIRRELINDPFAVGDDVELFLNRLMRELEIAPEAMDRRVFIAELIVPAYQHGLAMQLIRAGVAVGIFGKGWDVVAARPECAMIEPAWVGPIGGMNELRSAVANSAALVHPWPTRMAHPIHRHGKPVLGPSLSAAAFIRDARRLLRGPATAPPISTSPICLSEILKPRG